MALTKISRGLLSTGISDSSDATAITIDSSENVGIGTTSPTDKLTVAGNITVSDGSPEVTFQTGSSHYNWQLAAQESTNSAFEIAVGSADGDASNDSFSALMTVLQSGNIGIGNSSPTNLLHLYKYQADTDIRLQGSAGSYYITNDYSDDALTFIHNSTERMRIDSSGNLKFNSGFGSVGEAYGVRAWVNFDGNISSDAAIEEDGNVSSVVDNAVGDYTINFSSNMPDGHYAVSGFGVAYGTNNTAAGCHVGLHASSNGAYVPTTKTTSAVRVVFGFGYTSGLTDIRDGSIIIVR